MLARRTRWLLACLLLGCFGLPAGCHKPRGGVATLTLAAGDVKHLRHDVSSPGTPGTALEIDDLVTTGADSHAAVSFTSGHVILLGPSSTLLIERSGVTTAQMGEIGATLRSGTAHVRSADAQLRLTIGTPFGRIALGAGSEVEVSSAAGLQVQLGSVEVKNRDGTEQTIGAGASVAVQGLSFVLPGHRPRQVYLEPMSFALATAAKKQVEVQRAGETLWRKAKGGDQLAAGDRVRTLKADNTRLELGSDAAVLLAANSELGIKGAGRTAGGPGSALSLASGSVALASTRVAERATPLTIEVEGQEIAIEPGAQKAAVEVTRQSDGKVEVAVHLGRALLPSGQIIEAGKAATIEAGSRAMAVERPVALALIEVRPGKGILIDYTHRIPPLRFAWSAAGVSPPFALEVARDSGFRQVVFREAVGDEAFVYGRLTEGAYAWRVRVGDAWQQGSLTLERLNDDCASCKRLNLVDDNGESTVVYYQQTLPAITFRWSPVAGANKYRFKLFADGSFDAPKIDETVAATSIAIASGRLSEERTFWMVLALDDSANVVNTGAMNTLTIAYDNAVQEIDVRSPKVDATLPAGPCATQGAVALGASLAIDGKEVEVDEEGRFHATTELRPGLNQLVYRVALPEGDVLYQVRDVQGR
jgi:hypothetical protein